MLGWSDYCVTVADIILSQLSPGQFTILQSEIGKLFIQTLAPHHRVLLWAFKAGIMMILTFYPLTSFWRKLGWDEKRLVALSQCQRE